MGEIQKLTMEHYHDIIKLWELVDIEARVEGRDKPERMEEQLESGNILLLGKILNERLIGILLVSHDERKGWLNRFFSS